MASRSIKEGQGEGQFQIIDSIRRSISVREFLATGRKNIAFRYFIETSKSETTTAAA